MLKGIFGTSDNGSQVSSSSKRKSKRRDGDDDEDSQISRRSRADSTGTPSTSQRKSSRRESTEQSSGFHPTSTAFSSTSRSPYADVAAPSVASSYATAYTEPSNAPIQRPEVVRNESMADKLIRSERSSGSRRDSKRDSRGDMSRSIDDDDEHRNAGPSDTSRRDSRRKSSRKDTATRAAEEHDNSLAQNQFPGQEPAGFGVASPYRPPGLASDYYGDHGESIAEQPGVRPDRPSILISADQAHLLEPTVEAHPPPEPSSLGHVGAAAEFFGGDIVAEPMKNTTPSRSGREDNDRPGRRPSLKPGKDSTAGGASPRSSPGPDPRRRPLPQSQNSSSIGLMGAGAAPLAAGAMAAGVGAAAEYYTGNIAITQHDQPLPSGIPGRPDEVVFGSGRPYPPSTAGNQSQSYHTTTEDMQTTSSIVTSSTRPPRPSQSSSSNVPLYGAAAAAAGIAGAAYLAHDHTSAQHEQAFSQPPTDYQGRPSDMPFHPGQTQTQSFGPQQQQTRRRRTGAFGKFVDWFQDPAAVAEFEAYTEAIGVCKYCFEPGTTPAEAPRKHYYRRQRPSSGSRYGSSTRVDKLARYSSDENLRRRNSKKGYSTTEKVLATGLAGVGAAAVANEVYKNKNDFNDTYSVKSGQLDNRSRVSFQENEEERYSTSKRKSRRESEGLSRRDLERRRQSGSEGEVRYEKRSSRRRDSSGSDNRTTSRGGNLSTPVALAGAAAVGAALTSSGSRRRSRSRSKSPRRNRKGYYSKRVSPKHSYVNLNQTLEDSPSGPLGLGGFFSSPSSNSKRGKKKKGLFNFSNNSSSSSDADLVFGEGTVRRKDKRGRIDNRKKDGRQSGVGDAAAILGLAATGAALAAETSRRDDKGKRKEGSRTDSNRYEDDRNRRPIRDDGRDSTNKIKLQGYQDPAVNGDEGIWEDASDDDQSSVDMGLAYGGRLSSRASKESLNEGTNILGWRFGGNQRKREEEKRVRRQSSKPDLSGYDPLKTGLVAGAAGLAGAAAADYYARPGPVAVESPPKDMPPLRYVDPVPVDSREQTPKTQSMQSSVSPMSSPSLVTRTSAASLEHPQPFTPISKDVYHGRQSYTDAPSGPVVFDMPRRDSRGQETGIIPATGTVAVIGAAAIAINDVERERKRDNRRSATIPTAVPSLKESVSFDLTKEQEDREQRRERKRREKEARKAAEAASAARDATPKASIITGPERSPERKLETWRLRDAVKAGGPGSMEPPVRDPSPQSSTRDISGVQAQPLPTPERETRLSEIDRQLEELYAQHREQEARKQKEIEAARLAAAAVAVGAGVVVATSESASKGENKPRRKSSLRKSSKYRDQDVETESGVSVRSAPSASASDTGVETASERLARKAARRVQNQRTPSPVHQHDDYTTFFVPPELKDRMAEHNRDSEVNEAKIVDIVPGMRRAETFPDELYHVYGTEETDVPPMKLQWKVPMLGLVSPTPPPQSPSITAEKSPVILATSGGKDIGEPEIEDVDPRDIEPRRSNSKVTWGDHEINVYEVITPEYERDGHDFTTSSPEILAKKETSSSPLRQAFSAEDVETSREKDMNQPVPPVEKMTTEQREHVALGKDFADLPPSRDITRGLPETTPLIEERKPSATNSTRAMQFEQFNPAGSTTSGGSFYQSPFASTVSDLDLPITSSSSRVPGDGTRSVAGEIAEGPKEEMSEERVSKSERRRRERAEATAEAEKVMSETNTRDMAEPHVPGGFDDAPSDVNVFDYMVTSNGSTLPSASVLGASATSVLASNVGKGSEQETSTTSTTRDLQASEEQDFARPTRAETFDESAFVDSFATPKRADTFDEAALIDSFATPKRAETFAEGDFGSPKARTVTSDPEDWEKTSSSSKKSKKSKSRDDDYYASSKSLSKKKSKRDSQVFNTSDPDPDDDAKSTTSTPADPSRSKSKRKSSSSRQANDDDNDTRSVVSDTKSAASEPTGSSKRRGKEKDKETPKKSGWALLGGLIGAAAGSKSDVSSKSESRKKSGDSGSEKRRRSSKSSDPQRSRSASLSSSTPLPAGERERDESVDVSVDEAFVSADENGANGHGHVDARDVHARDLNVGEGAEESFLAMRPELPTTKPMASESVTETGSGNGASGLPTIQSESHASLPQSSMRDLDSAPQIAVENADPGDLSTPRQRRLSNLRTTDLGSSPTISSPARLGRFPVSPGIIRTSSVGSPPTATAPASASSPLTTPRTRQGRPSSTDFRSGKEFRPLYLVERHSATKTPVVGEEEETYPSLPSSRTSSAHPSLENLRGEYSDGDVDVVSSAQQTQTREVGRRYSWSDSHARARSPEFLDSGDVTPTQETFPVGVIGSVGGKKEKEKEKEKTKPKYEFHSPSELLEDPSRHREDVPETTDTVGSPLPSAVGTEWSVSPTEDSGSRSRSRSSSGKAQDHDVGVGLGIGAGLVGAAAGAFAADRFTRAGGDDEANQSGIVARDVEVPDSKSKRKDEEFTLQPVERKKGKKDKDKDRKGKKKGRILDLDDDDKVEPEPVPESAAAVQQTMETADDEKTPMRDLDLDGRDVATSTQAPPPSEMPESEPAPEAEAEDEWATPTSSKKSKKSKKDKKGGSKRKDFLPLDVEDQDQPQAEGLTEPPSAEPTTATAIDDTTAATRDLTSTNLDSTDSTAHLDEKTSHGSFPFNATSIVSPVGNQDQNPSLPPSHGPFEAAFEAARAARGLPEGVSKEVAMDGLVASSPTPSVIQPVDIADIPEQDNEKNPFGDDYEMGSSASRNINVPGSFRQESNPSGDDFEVAPTESVPVKNRVEVLPTIMEAETPRASLLDLTRGAGEGASAPEAAERSGPSKDIEQTEAETGTPSEQVDEFAWAPAKKSKKEKKAKKKSTTIEGFESESPDTGSQTPLVEDQARDIQADIAREEPARDVVETTGESKVMEEPVLEPAEDDWAVPAKKSKKEKKSKGKGKSTASAFDALEPESQLSETVAPEVSAGDETSREVQEPVQVADELQELPATEEPKAVEEPVEDEWAVPVKKSKKDKKSKKKSAVFDDFESESPATGSQTPANEESRQVQETAPLTEEPEQLTLAGEPKTVEEPVEDEWAVPTKKAKKDKKSKRKTLDFDSAEPTETSTPASESRDVERDESPNPLAASTPGLAAGTLAGLAGASILDDDKDKPAEDDERAATSSKKSKKDKKSKKKGKVFSLADDEESTPATDTPEPERDVDVPQVSAGEQAVTTEEPATVDETERHTAFAENLSAEPEGIPVQSMEADREAPAEENEWAVPTKKSKKDKKSKKRGSLAILAEEQPAEETSQREQEPERQGLGQSSRAITEDEFPVAPTAAHVDDVTGHYFGMLKDYQPAPGAPDNKAAETSREAIQAVIAPADEVHGAEETRLEYPAAVSQMSEAAERNAPALASLNAAHNFPVIREVAHVDDVVGFHYDLLKDYKPDTAGKQQSKEIAEQIVPGSLEAVARDSSTLSSPHPAHDFPVVADVAHVDEVVGLHYGMLKDYKPDTDSIQQSKEIAEQIVPASSDAAATFAQVDPEEDAWAVPVKKSKKDKKKTCQSLFGEEQLDAESAPPEAPQKDSAGDTAMSDEPRELTEQNAVLVDQPMETDPATTAEIVAPSATNQEDLYPVVTKKSKKDKKTRRQSTFDDFEETSTEPSKDVSEADAALPVAAGVGAAAIGAGILASSQDAGADEVAVVETPAVEEDFTSSSSKKSKKDKKKRQQSTFDDFNDEQTAPPAPEESKDVTTDALVPPNNIADTAVPFKRPGEVFEAPAEAGEQPFEFSTKKSKKDKKKKRGSTFDDFDTAPTSSVDDLGVSAPVTGTETVPESLRDVSETMAPAEDETFVTPAKKGKKDKKKRRQSTFDDVETEETATLQAEERQLSGLTEEIEAAPDTRELEIPASKAPEPVLGDDGWPIEQAVSQPAPIEDEAWAVPTKQSKKDKKKKKKTLLSWADGEDSTSQPTEPTTPAEPAEAREVQMQVPAPGTKEMAIKSEAQSAIVPESAPIVVARPLDEDGHAMKHQGHQSKSVPGAWGEEEEDPIVDEPMVEEPTQDVEDPGDRDINHGQQEVEQIPEEEDMRYVVKKSKKDKKGKKSRKDDANSEELESREVEAAQIAAVPETLEQAQVENASDEVTKEAAPEDEWAFTTKKSKNDKKSKKSKNVVDAEVATPEILAIPETSQESSGRDAGGDDEWAVPTKKDKKDKKSKRQSTRDVVEDAQPEEPLALPVNDPDPVDDVAGHYHGILRDYRPAEGAPDNKPWATSREIVNEPGVRHIDDVTGHYYSMLRDYRPTEAAPDNKPLATSGAIVNEASVPHIDEVTGHYYGMLREYQPAAGDPDNKPALAPRKPEDAQRAERLTSPVSDEEIRRARRARRKASPVYRGEEPEDLQGNRSLTPPADHDDMMNTALGVAAGLGLTGAAATAVSARPSASEARSLDGGQPSTAQAPGWSFAKMNAPGDVHQAQRDSGVQFADSPTLSHEQFDSRNRDSGYVKSPANRESWPEEASRETGVLDTSNRPPRPQSPTSSSEDVSGKRSKRVSRDIEEAFTRREPSPVLSTSKDRSSQLFNSSPSNRPEGVGEKPRLDTAHLSEPTTDIHRSPSIHGHHRSREELRARGPARSEPRHVVESLHEQSTAPEPHRSIFGPYPTQDGHERGLSPPKTPLHTISEHSQDTSPSLRRQRDMSDVGEGHPRKAVQHQESGRNLRDAAGIAVVATVGALAARELSRDDQPATRAKSLGKSNANTKSSRSLRRATFDPEVVPSSSAHDPSEGKGKEVARDMSDVYDGHGEYPGPPMSPTRPPSMRKRQSMQQIKDLETRLDQLVAENRNLAEAKIIAERHLEDIQLEQHKSGYAGQEAVDTANVQLREKDEAIARLQQELEGIRQDHARLSEVNAGLSDAHENLRTEHEQRYSQLEDLHAETRQNWQESSRELETLRGQHTELSGGMEDIVQHEIDTALAEKNAEIERLRGDLEIAKEKINELEQQVLSGGGDNILNFRDEDYFENACQSLCQHVQQWVLRFSKFSDTLVCRTTHQIRDEKLVDRFDLAILDGSDVDVYLGDRIKRRDVFMSVVMTMIFEYVFTRYLFGMDRDQRQTLKKLEKNLAEVGPPGAVHQWRAMTLTLLAKREAFKASRENDTEAVVLQVYDTLAKFLPPPQNLQAQVQEALRNVMRTAVDLSIEMRTQKAEYIMLPPLQPEYDTNGDLTRKVYFNASLMNERSGETSSNDELEAQQAVVRMVLFPLVVKKGNDDGEGEEEIVVCPAQVLVARPDRKSKANSGRVVSAQSDRMSVDQMSRANASRHSLAPSTMDMSNVI